MRRKRQQGEGGPKKDRAGQQYGTDTVEVPTQPDEEEEIQRIEVPANHWLIKRRWKIVKRKKGDVANDGGTDEKKQITDDEEDKDTEYEYEVDKRRVFIFVVTRLIAVGLLFLFLHTILFNYVWDPISRPRLTPRDEQLAKFKAMGKL